MIRYQRIRLKEETDLTVAEQFAIACGAHLTIINGGYLNTVSTGLEAETLHEILGWWDFNDRESALKTINRLFKTGHRLYFNHIVNVTAKYPEEEWDEQLVDLARKQGLGVDLVQFKNNILAGYTRMMELNFVEVGYVISTIGAWDLGRLINVCRWSCDLGYISEAEARQITLQASQFLQPAYRSWEDMSLGYLMGRQMWGGSMDDVENVHQMLLADPTSPWRTIPYNFDLKDTTTMTLPTFTPEPLTEAQLFGIACGGHLTVVNEARFDTLETGMPKQAHDSLPEWWGIVDRESALEALNGLLESGHREYYDLIIDVLDNHPAEQWDRQLRDLRRQHAIDRDLVQYKNNLLRGFRELRRNGFLSPEQRVSSVSAYDYSRAVNVARWCHDLGYITEEEAWQVIDHSAQALQQTYPSWADMGGAYLLGRYMWGSNEIDMTDSEAAIQQLLTDANSPWKVIDWSTPLDDDQLTIYLDEQMATSLKEQFALACGAHLAVINEHPLNTFAVPDAEDLRETTRTMWGIDDRQSAIDTIEKMMVDGHHTLFDQIRVVMLSYDEDEWAERLQPLQEELGTRYDLAEYSQNIQLGYDYLVEQEVLADGERVDSILAWDLGRIINVSRWCLAHNYITVNEAREYILQAGERLQQTYPSWEAMSKAYLLGRYMWGGEDDWTELHTQVHSLLLSDPSSPWQTIDWNTPLADGLRFEAQTTISVADQFAVACGAHLSVLDNMLVNTLRSGLEEETSRRILSQWWEITDRDTALQTINWLMQSGHREGNNDLIAVLNTYPAAAWDEYLGLTDADLDEEDRAAIAEQKNEVLEAAERLRRDGLLADNAPVPDLTTWDFGRVVNLCRWSYDCGFLSEQEAWQGIRIAASHIQQTYPSWEVMSLSYLMGLSLWGGDESLPTSEQAHRLLLSHPRSPWVIIPWNTPLE